ncbi:MAG: hypothetical protein WC564_01335 [Patescibacteria group bacterium]
MEDKAIQFLEKLDELSEEIKVYFSSGIESQVLKEIQKDYQLSSDELDDLVYDFFIADFKFATLDNSLKNTKVPGSSHSKLAADILGKLFLPVAPFLKLDIKAEIVRRGHRPEIYEKYVEDFSDLIEDKNFSAMEELIDLHESTFNPVEEENLSLDFFTNGLKGILNDNDIGPITTLNGALIYLLVNKPEFHNKINKALLNNQEVITTQSLIWKEEAVRGTVANWIKDFIRENGSDIYNSVVLSRYLATSPNPQLLNEEERKIVRRLIKLYRNLFFFPDSMSDIPMEEWEIVPVEKVSVEKPIPGAKPKVIVSEVAPVVFDKKEEIKETPVEKKTVASAVPVDIAKIEADLEDSKLASLLTRYLPNSLENKVVKEEIKKRKKK